MQVGHSAIGSIIIELQAALVIWVVIQFSFATQMSYVAGCSLITNYIEVQQIGAACFKMYHIGALCKPSFSTHSKSSLIPRACEKEPTSLYQGRGNECMLRKLRAT